GHRQYLASDDTAGIPPTVHLTSPAPGETVVEGATLALAAEATDDVAVAAVTFLVNGEVVATATTAPYQATVTVPVGATSLTLGATASDLGSNTGTAAEVVVSVIPDPKTTAAGRVVDKGGTPVAGATVACLEVSGLTGAAGTFALPDVPTTQR